MSVSVKDFEGSFQLSHLVALSLHPFHVCSEYYFLRGLQISEANTQILSYPILERRMFGSNFLSRGEA